MTLIPNQSNVQRCTVALTTLFVLALPAAAAGSWESARPGRPLHFPADHASHPAFKTEWWYYTGHLQTESGRRYGYELTFFRQGTEPALKPQNPWQAKHVYLTHLALTDVDGKTFRYAERTNRPGLGIAGAATDRFHTWNDDWVAEELGGTQHLTANDKDFALDLLLDSVKPPVLHGDAGYSRKGTCDSCASHYYSLTRLKTRGYLRVGDQTERVTGLSWMDHEFGSGQLEAGQQGWDWFSLQLSDGSDLMLYRLRRQDGAVVLQSAGTFVTPDGKTRHLTRDQVTIVPKGTWRSAASGAVYPMGWTITVPTEGLQVTLAPATLDQELRTARSTGVTYWEGAVSATGRRQGQPVTAQGYVEMTGYAKTDRPKF
ncbi:MAG: carotenoid 1,2-hydratase [Candidatus Sericytochromatia bacterium]|nr:carotenoid 1,2-hydratase [Candidatus Sericytochromatia bacterium]